MENWQDKIYIYKKKSLRLITPKINSFGLFFEIQSDSLIVNLLPINKSHKSLDSTKTYETVLFFEREFIEEDDVEYALDVLKLFQLKENSEIVIGGVKASQVLKIIKFIIDEINSELANYQIIKSLLKVLLLQLIRIEHTNLLPQDLKQNRVYDFLQLLEIHFKNEIKAEFYAYRLKISEKRLNQILKEKLNFTANQLIKQRQITEIKRELQKKDKNIKELAFEYGFNSVSAFSRFFKRYTKVSPKNFKMWN